jgi:diaminohydroxyphosphoribosylaminopyrimidine deaminase/5-amino-6-(5-phosphoribosylamino)uracil reductase
MERVDLEYLEQCALIATQQPDEVSPVKMGVGCIIVKDGKIVGKGHRWTKILQKEPYKDITYHAEHCAITNAGPLCKGATLYCTMEPCNKRVQYEHPTPRCCCELIKESGIKRVVYIIDDENLGEGGKEELIKGGIEVESFNN